MFTKGCYSTKRSSKSNISMKLTWLFHYGGPYHIETSLLICRKYFIVSRRFLLHHKCDVLCNLVPLVQFKKHEKHPWRSVLLLVKLKTEACNLLKVGLLRGCFSCFWFVQMVTNHVRRHKYFCSFTLNDICYYCKH